MADALQNLVEKLQARFGDTLLDCKLDCREVTVEVSPARAIEVFTALRDEHVILSMRDANSSALVQEAGNERSRHVVMPLRL